VKFELSISEAAKSELREAFLWYEDQLVNLGDKFQEEIFSAFESIKSNPNKFQIRYENVRVYFLRKFPFGIHYTQSENLIIIIGIFHTSQNPEKWRKSGL
jgi:plasmid stabilization system protein ParE